MKKGSALLVVLGMIAFMVISAVAFSAYMRYSRLPSSYLLRTSSSRHLVKAALAEAIDIIDVSIGNNPHPDVGDKKYPYPRRGGDSRNRNFWRSNCFIGTNQLVNAEDTVSTLTMEGLAYLPPALINEARYYSRHSSAAIWKTLGFDSGRYAFSAIDVSDHFDINRIRAAVARDSSDRGRISLAHIFENEMHTWFETDLSVWDTFVAKYYDPQDPYDTSKVPFTSLADLNLAINYSKPSKIISPFCRYLESGGGTDFVTSMTGEDSNMMRSMAFVTDSYFPRSSSAEKEEDNDYSLCDEENQPFDDNALKATANTIMTPYMYESKGATRLRESVCGLGKLQLWDYLDEDSVPLSLAIPTVERTPMVCAVQTSLVPSTFKVIPSEEMTYEPAETAEPTPGMKRSAIKTLSFKADPGFTSAFMGGKVKVVAAFPFLRDEEANGSFEIGGKLSFFLSSPDLEFRAGGVLHLDRDYDRKVTPLPVNGMINIPFQTQPAWRPSGITKEADALKEFDFVLGHAAGPVAEWFNGHDIVTVRYRWEQTYTKVSEDPPTYQWLPEKMPEETKAEYAHCSMPPIDAAGAVNGNYAKDDEFLKIVNGNGGDNVVFQACVWVWVKDTRSNKLVDLVPACMKDDDELNSFNNFSTPIGNFLKDIGGSPYPLMKFTGAGDAFKYSLDELKGSLAADGRQVIITPRAVMVADPRYNYAPEHWFEFKDSDGALTKEKWLEKCERGKDDRDRDIFMATSDMGHLQSVYELAFLPRLTDLRGHGENTYYGDMNRLNGMTKFADAFEGSANSHLAWRTYRCFSLSLEHSGYRDDFEGVGFNSEGSGFRVNPYSSSTPIIMAALANTPYNWMVASTNETAPNALSKSDREVKNFVKNYCFNQMGPLESRFDWKDLELVANQIKSAARGAVGGNWQTAFDNLDWAGNFSDLAGANFLEDGLTVDLYDVDRKFLYGFWRDSFAVKQQLFLVFVRAEPLMMGGGAIGQTPPQLGARAVALVWRDPTINDKDPNAPHRTRVLFYRQFD